MGSLLKKLIIIEKIVPREGKGGRPTGRKLYKEGVRDRWFPWQEGSKEG